MNKPAKNFTDLIVWQKSRQLVLLTHAEAFSNTEHVTIHMIRKPFQPKYTEQVPFSIIRRSVQPKYTEQVPFSIIRRSVQPKYKFKNQDPWKG